MTEALHRTPAARPRTVPGLHTWLAGLPWRPMPALQHLLWRADGCVQPLRTAPEAVAVPETLWTDWPAWCAAHPGARCTLHLPTTLVHELLVPAEHAQSDTQALAWAAAQWSHFYGDEAAAWPLAVWQLGARRGVSALHGMGPAWGALNQVAQTHGVQLQAVVPQWLQRCQQALRTEPALHQGPARLLLADGPLLGVLDLQQGALQALQWRRAQGVRPASAAVSAVAAAAVADAEGTEGAASSSDTWPQPAWPLWRADTGPTFCSADAASSVLQRLPGADGSTGLSRAPAPAAVGLAEVTSRSASGGLSHRLQRGVALGWSTPTTLHAANFLQPTRQVHRLAWWLALAAVAALATAALDAAQAWRALQAAQAPQAMGTAGQTAAVQPRPRRTGAAPAAPSTRSGEAARTASPALPRSVARTPAAAAEERLARQQQASLQRPWGPAFAALDAAALPGVQWQALQTTEQGAWRLQGQAPDTATALAAAQALRQQPVWAQVLPGRIERQAEAGVSFELSLQWRGAW